MSNYSHFVSVLGHGALTTVELTVGGIVVATIAAFAAGILSRSRLLIVRIPIRIWVEGWRGSSEVVQLFWVAFAAPTLIGFRLVPLWAGILVVGLNIGAYGAEIVRGALDAVPQEQREGALALSLNPWQQLRLVLLPQSVIEMVPPFNTLFIQLIQATALASLITVSDIAYQGKQILEPTTPSNQIPLLWTVMLVMYLILSLVLTGMMRLVELAAAHWAGRPPQPIKLRLFVRPGSRDLAAAGPGTRAGGGAP